MVVRECWTTIKVNGKWQNLRLRKTYRTIKSVLANQHPGQCLISWNVQHLDNAVAKQTSAVFPKQNVVHGAKRVVIQRPAFWFNEVWHVSTRKCKSMP